MSIPTNSDSQIRDRLHAAVDDTTAPPAFAQVAMSGGRARRRRRHAATVLVAGVVVASGATLLTQTSPLALDGQVASGSGDAAQLEWARSLSEGPAPELPFFGEGGLWAGGQQVPLPATVNESVPPRTVAGGWLVLTGQKERDLAYAVFSADGSLRNLPAVTYENGLGDARAVVSADGRRAALGEWIVDLETMELTDLPHAPEQDEVDGYYTSIRVIGFTDQGLVYEGAPFDEGFGTTWLLPGEGPAVRINPPRDSRILDGSPADVALEFDYTSDTSDTSDTCATMLRLESAAWVEREAGCSMSDYLGKTVAVSDDAHWLLTEDLPQVWDLSEGRYAEIDIPTEQVKSWGDGWPGIVVWEDDDSFLIPVTDPGGDSGETGAHEQTVQVVRCTMSTGECQRAGDEQHLVISTEGMDTNGVRFADQ